MRLVRLLRGMTQLALARQIGVSQGQYSMIERGQVPATDAQRAALARALGVSPRGLFRRVRLGRRGAGGGARADDLDGGRDDD